MEFRDDICFSGYVMKSAAFLCVCFGVTDNAGAAQAIHRLLDIRGAKFDDVVVVQANTQTVIRKLKSMSDEHAGMVPV